MRFFGKVSRGYNILPKPYRDVREQTKCGGRWWWWMQWWELGGLDPSPLHLFSWVCSDLPLRHLQDSNISFLLDYNVSLPYEKNPIQSVFCFYIYVFAYTSFLSSVLAAYLWSIFLKNAWGVCLCSLLLRHNCNAIGKLLCCSHIRITWSRSDHDEFLLIWLENRACADCWSNYGYRS